MGHTALTALKEDAIIDEFSIVFRPDGLELVITKCPARVAKDYVKYQANHPAKRHLNGYQIKRRISGWFIARNCEAKFRIIKDSKVSWIDKLILKGMIYLLNIEE